MISLRRVLGASALVIGSSLAVIAPSSLGSAQSGDPGPVTVTVVLTGDAGGDVGNVLLTINRHTDGVEAASAAALVGGNVFTLPPGAYDLVPSVSDAAYVITGQTCQRQGNGQPGFTISGPGSGPPVEPACTVNVTYTAPVVTTAPPDTTEPTDTTPPSDSAAPTTPVDTTVPAAAAAPTTDAVGALPPGGASTGTIPVTGPTDQTLALALAGVVLVMLGSGAMVAARRR